MRKVFSFVLVSFVALSLISSADANCGCSIVKVKEVCCKAKEPKACKCKCCKAPKVRCRKVKPAKQVCCCTPAASCCVTLTTVAVAPKK